MIANSERNWIKRYNITGKNMRSVVLNIQYRIIVSRTTRMCIKTKRCKFV